MQILHKTSPDGGRPVTYYNLDVVISGEKYGTIFSSSVRTCTKKMPDKPTRT